MLDQNPQRGAPARFGERLSSDDNIQLLIGSFHDRRGAFVFGTNPNGAKWDAQLRRGARVVPNAPSRTVAGNRAPYRLPLTHNGQRWCALAVQDYESRALPLSYGGGRRVIRYGTPRLTVQPLLRHRGAETEPPAMSSSGKPDRRSKSFNRGFAIFSA